MVNFVVNFEWYGKRCGKLVGESVGDGTGRSKSFPHRFPIPRSFPHCFPRPSELIRSNLKKVWIFDCLGSAHRVAVRLVELAELVACAYDGEAVKKWRREESRIKAQSIKSRRPPSGLAGDGGYALCSMVYD